MKKNMKKSARPQQLKWKPIMELYEIWKYDLDEMNKTKNRMNPIGKMYAASFNKFSQISISIRHTYITFFTQSREKKFFFSIFRFIRSFAFIKRTS